MRPNKVLITPNWHYTLDTKLSDIDFNLPGNKLHAELKSIENTIRLYSADLAKLDESIGKLFNKVQQLVSKNPLNIRAAKLEALIKCYVETELDLNQLKNLLINTFFTEESRELRYVNDALFDEYKSHFDEVTPDIYKKDFLNNTEYFSEIANHEINYRMDTEEVHNLCDYQESLDKLGQYFDHYDPEYITDMCSILNEYEVSWGVVCSKITCANKVHLLKLAKEVDACNNSIFNTQKEIERLFYFYSTIKPLELDNKHAEKNTNFVVANIGFVVKIGNDHKFISYPICVNNRLNVSSVYDSFNDNYTSLLKKGEKLLKRNSMFDTYLKKVHPLKITGDIYTSTIYENVYYHSENALFLHLLDQEYLSKIVRRLIKEQPNIAQVELVVLDLHSSRYMCENCMSSLQYMGNPNSPMLQLLSGLLRKNINAQVIPEHHPLQLLSRVSADIPFPKESDLKTAESHIQKMPSVNTSTSSILLIDSTSIRLGADKAAIDSILFLKKLNQHTVLVSGGSNDKQKTTYLSVFNTLVTPLKVEASNRIKNAYRRYKNRKKIEKDISNSNLQTSIDTLGSAGYFSPRNRHPEFDLPENINNHNNGIGKK